MLDTPDELLCLRANAPQFDAAQGAAGLPTKLLVLGWGEHDTPQGKVICDDTTMKQLSAYNAAKNWDRTALDFEHNSVPGSPTYAGEPVKIAGYGKLELVKGEGIYLLMSSWTPEGKTFAADGHYGDLSPVVKVNKANEVIGLHSVALCRHGATPGLVFLSALPAVQHGSAAKQTPIQKPSKKNKAMADTAPPQTADELFAALKGVLNLGPDATAADVLTAMTKALAAAKAEPDGDEGEGADKGETKALSANILKLTKLVEDQGAQLKLLSSGVETGERQQILAQATREGKQVPATAAKTMDVANLKLLCAELPVTVPLEKRTPEATLMLSSSAGFEDPELAKIAKITGVSDEDRKKHLGA